MARKKKPEEHENHERWLVSYADFITLLFAFFVVMYSISSVNEGKYRVLSDSLIAVFESSPEAAQSISVDLGKSKTKQKGIRQLRQAQFQSPNPGKPSESDPSTTSMMPVGESEASPFQEDAVSGKPRGNMLKKMESELTAALAPLIAEELLTIRTSDLWVEVEMKEDISFYPRTAELRQRAFPVLEVVANIFKDIPNAVQIEGFTDNTPIGTDEFPTNWELSAARAASVVRYFQSKGIHPSRLAAIGYGEHQPLVSNDTPEGRKKNRRIVMVLSTNETPRRVMDEPEPEPEKKVAPVKPVEVKKEAPKPEVRKEKTEVKPPVEVLNTIKQSGDVLDIGSAQLPGAELGNIPMIIQPVAPPSLLDKSLFMSLPARPNIIPDIKGEFNKQNEAKQESSK